MSKESKIIKRREVKKKGVFDINKIYKELKSQIKERGFDYTEKERTWKQQKKGDKYKFEILGDKKFDDFVEFHFKIVIDAEEVKHGKVDGKVMQMGDFRSIFSCWIVMDYLNKWNKNKITKFLFDIYTNYLIKDKIDDYYEAKCVEECVYFNDLIKELVKDGR